MKLEPKLEEIRWNIAKEKEILEEWAKRKVYKFELNSKKVFSIDTPPPYPRPF
jgi:valyl-tRNA synthetase